MIKGKQVQPRAFSEKPNINYRKLDALNQTMLKVFDSDPVKFFEEFKLGKVRKQKKNLAFMIGDLVDFYLLECKGDEQEFTNRFDEKFALFSGSKGTGQVFVLADYLFEETESSLNETGEITISFMERFRAAYNRIIGDGKYYKEAKSETGFKDLDSVLEDFENKGRAYFDTLSENIGKTVVDVGVIEKAKAVGNLLLHDLFSKKAFSCHEDFECMTHFAIEWKYILDADRSIVCKSEIDILQIDHDNRIIYPIDLKTTYDNESFDAMYLKHGYYLQNSFYIKALEEWAKAEGMKKYEVRPMKFVVGDTSANNRRPLVYETSENDVEAGMYGFDIRGVHYRGVDELVRDIAWAEENDVWNCSKEAFDNKGQLKLKIKYDVL